MSKLEFRNTKAAKLTEALVERMREEYAQGATQSSLSLKYRISVVQVGRIVRGESWQRAPTAISERAMNESLQRLIAAQQEVDLAKQPSAREKMARDLVGKGDEYLNELTGEQDERGTEGTS